jgi:hypothetical protein
MKTHITLLSRRMLRAGLRNHTTRYRVVAAGLDYRNRIISISTNSPRLESRGWHAEERLLHSSPRSLVRIIIARYNRKGDMLPIDPCDKCKRLASKYGVQIDRLER